MDPMLEKSINYQKELREEFQDRVTRFSERCQTYLHGIFGLSEEEEEEEEEE